MSLQKYTKEWLEELCANSYSYAQVLVKAGRKPGGGNQSYLKSLIQQYQIDISHFKHQGWNKGITKEVNPELGTRKYSIDELLVEDSIVARKTIRKYVLWYNVIEYKCANCGNTGNWQGEEMALELDHINGINNDNRKENLRFLCPNCHAITPTNSGKNNKLLNEAVVK